MLVETVRFVYKKFFLQMLFKYYTLDEAEYRAVNQPPIVRHISYTGIIKKVLSKLLFT